MLKVVERSDYFDYYLNDPTTPYLFSRIPLPKLSDSYLKLEIIGFREGALFQEDSVRIQAASILHSIISTLSWVNKIRKVEKWAVPHVLKVSPRAGKQFNAYYDRYALHFFYEIHPYTKKMVFSCESTEAVNHEFGHAILDSFRPDLWDLSIFEIFAFHEAFGDIISMLSSLQHIEIIEYVLAETGGDLSRSNVVSRMVEEMGNAICCKEPSAGRPSNCLRDASLCYPYVDPSSLPIKCPFNVLGREVHNFSRVFSSAWYKIFVEIYNFYSNKDKIEAIITSREIMSNLSILCLSKIEKRKDLFCSVAESMIQIDKDFYSGEHMNCIRNVFFDRNIMPIHILH